MKKSIIAAGLAGTILLWPGSADAHHPEISVSSTCIDDDYSFINIHTEAWNEWFDGSPVDSERRVNNNVIVTMTNSNLQDAAITIGTGKYTYENGFKFDLTTVQTTASGPVTVRVTSVVNWGTNGQYEGAGEFRVATVDLTDDCKDAPVVTTTTSPTTTTTTPTPTTTSGSGGGNSRVIEREFPTVTPAVPVPVVPKFAG